MFDSGNFTWSFAVTELETLVDSSALGSELALGLLSEGPLAENANGDTLSALVPNNWKEFESFSSATLSICKDCGSKLFCVFVVNGGDARSLNPNPCSLTEPPMQEDTGFSASLGTACSGTLTTSGNICLLFSTNAGVLETPGSVEVATMSAGKAVSCLLFSTKGKETCPLV